MMRPVFKLGMVLALVTQSRMLVAWEAPRNVTRLGASADAGGGVLAISGDRVHVLVSRTGQKIWSEVVENGICSPLTELTAGVSPAIATDSLGHAHAVYSLDWEIRYREWNGSWSADSVRVSDGTGDSIKPWICVDVANNLHVVWSKGATVWYNRRSAATLTWDGPVTIPNTSDLEGYFSPRVAVIGTSPIVLFGKHNAGAWNAWFASHETGTWVTTLLDSGSGCSNGDIAVSAESTVEAVWDRGYSIYGRRRVNGAWSSVTLLSGGASATGPRVSAPSAGQVDYIWSQSPGEIWATHWNGSTYTALARIASGGNGQEIESGTDGRVYMSRSYSWDIWLSSSGEGLDATAPPAISGASATAQGAQALLQWTNPRAIDLARVLIVMRTDRAPLSPTDGTLLLDRPAEWGADSFTHVGLAYYGTYHYAIFLRDDVSNTSSPVFVTATGPAMRPDFDLDQDVDQEDFGMLQKCLSGAFVPQYDAPCMASDFDRDGDVDADDMEWFTACLGGPRVSIPSGCAG